MRNFTAMSSKRLLQDLLIAEREFKLEEKLILRDHLALVRTRLANETALLSYIRSSLYLLIGGLALLQVEGHGDFRWVAYPAFVLSALFLIVGVHRYHSLRVRLTRYYAEHERALGRAAEELDGPPAA